jgi:hypothetical protein
MVTWDDVRRLALSLPETAEKLSWGHAFWTVKGKGFVWERPLRKTDLKQLAELGRPIPEGPLMGLRVEDLGVKEALLAEGRPGIFTIPHFDGYSAVLVELEKIDAEELLELVQDAWAAVAPKRVLDAHFPDRRSAE